MTNKILYTVKLLLNIRKKHCRLLIFLVGVILLVEVGWLLAQKLGSTPKKSKSVFIPKTESKAQNNFLEKKDFPKAEEYSGNNASLDLKGWTFPQIFDQTLQKSPRIHSTFDAALLAAELSKNTFIPNTQIPKIIHQTWSSYAPEKSYILDSIQSWKSLNSEYIHLLWNDTDIDLLVKHFYSINYDHFSKLPRPVHKADFFRYMVLHSIGGVYSDVDTICLKPLENWVQRNDLKNWNYKGSIVKPRMDGIITFLAGVEADVYFSYGEIWRGTYTTPLQMCQWTIAGSAEANVIELTGPGPWTRSIFWSWRAYGIHWRDLREFGDQSRVIDDQLIFPITAFSPGIKQTPDAKFGNMGSHPLNDSAARVQHFWKGSWRS